MLWEAKVNAQRYLGTCDPRSTAVSTGWYWVLGIVYGAKFWAHVARPWFGDGDHFSHLNLSDSSDRPTAILKGILVTVPLY